MIKDSERQPKRLTDAEKDRKLMAFLHKADRFYGRMLWASCILFTALIAAACMQYTTAAMVLIVLFLLVGLPTLFLILAYKFIRFTGALRCLIEKLTEQERL